MNENGIVLGNLLLAVISGYLGGRFIYYGIKAVIKHKFEFFPTWVFGRAIASESFFKGKYPTAKGWWGVFIGFLVILVALPLLAFCLYFLEQSGLSMMKDLSKLK